MKTLLAITVILFMCSPANADDIQKFTRTLNQSGTIYHDQSFRGKEVVFQSSGPANRFAARAAWRQSPPHNALLPGITRVVCRGNVCVGRGR